MVWSPLGLAVLLAAGGYLWVRVLHRGPPPGVMKDIRAGLPARSIKDPDERLAKYLENRYGPMTDPANRQQVFVDFFDVDRIKALQFLVQHSPEESRQANIDAMARWVAGYRASLTPQEQAALRDRFLTPEGQAVLRRATAQYNSQDVRYRGSTAPVISQLLRTLSAAESGQ